MLIVLDNFEHIAEAAVELPRRLASCPNLTLLVTTRETLRVQGELELGVPPLAAAEAIELFCVRSGGEPSNDIAELCARLDSLPLAIELAAARTKVLTPRQMLDRFPQLLDVEGARDADARQRTLRASIRWSYDLLSDDEQGAFRRLAVLEGARLETAEEAAATDTTNPPCARREEPGAGRRRALFDARHDPRVRDRPGLGRRVGRRQTPPAPQARTDRTLGRRRTPLRGGGLRLGRARSRPRKHPARGGPRPGGEGARRCRLAARGAVPVPHLAWACARGQRIGPS